MINELSAYCINNTGSELVGPILGRMPVVYGSNYVVGMEYWTMGTPSLPAGNYWVVGGSSGPWHQIHPTVMMGATVTGTSQQNGAQYEVGLYVEYFDNNPSYPTAWWVGTSTVGWIGYLDVAEVGFVQLNTKACSYNHYSEAYDADQATTPWMKADMGSGTFVASGGFSANYGSRAWFRQPKYYAAKNGGSPTSSTSATNTDPFCYNGKFVTDGTPAGTWNPTDFFGGPGADGPTCTKDPTCLTGLASGTACCALACGKCGGPGCGGLPGGSAACCTGTINTSGVSCASNRPPCKI